MPIRCPNPPPDKLPALSLRTVKPNTNLFRVGSSDFSVDAWDPRTDTNYRFSPLPGPDKAPVPVSYLGTTPDVVLLETILRFTPDGGGGYVAKKHYRGKYLAEVETTRELKLVALCGPEAQALGENVAVGISHAFAAEYPITRRWAARFFQEFPKADGIEWISHQEGRNTAILLWPRLEQEQTAPFQLVDGPHAIESPDIFSKLCELANITGHTLEFP